MFGTKNKRKALNKINNSSELLNLIKDCSTSSSNWKDGNKTLVIRIGMGVRKYEDDELKLESLSEYGFLLDSELEASQEPLDNPKEKIDKKNKQQIQRVSQGWLMP